MLSKVNYCFTCHLNKTIAKKCLLWGRREKIGFEERERERERRREEATLVDIRISLLNKGGFIDK